MRTSKHGPTVSFFSPSTTMWDLSYIIAGQLSTGTDRVCHVAQSPCACTSIEFDHITTLHL
ncbi:unnamed protein product [Arabidopsis halleri]